jgi:peptidoglycan/xylan/chitin deacetylase (PgdA/CDA1 family)
MYHRVAEVDMNPWGLCVAPQHFAQHLEVLRQYAHPISLQELAEAHRNGNIPSRAVAITFDDGYADNLYQAKPLLEQYGIPATVFATAGYIGRNREFWWDELERLLLQPGQLPEKLCLNINGNTHQLELGEAANYSEADYQRDRQLRACESQPGSRLFLCHLLGQLLKPLPEEERLQVLDELAIWSNTGSIARPTHRPLSWEELRILGEGKLVEIGAHTVTHPLLSAHSPDFQLDEIQQGKAYLEEKLARSVTTFAYPYGNYTPETVKLVQKAGFACACSTVEDIVWRESDRFQLPRFEVRNWDREEFAKQLLTEKPGIVTWT